MKSKIYVEGRVEEIDVNGKYGRKRKVMKMRNIENCRRNTLGDRKSVRKAVFELSSDHTLTFIIPG